jgi:hypothetical protein
MVRKEREKNLEPEKRMKYQRPELIEIIPPSMAMGDECLDGSSNIEDPYPCTDGSGISYWP